MEREEVDYRFMNREPVEGLAFLLDDCVEVTTGPHRGASGSVIAVRALEPEPLYSVELTNGQHVDVSQSGIVGVGTAGALAELQAWYSAQCNGHWEHAYGIKIETLDNPGWQLVIDLIDTGLADTPFDKVAISEPDREWIYCEVKQRRFDAVGGPHMLGRMIRTFLEWAKKRPGEAA